MNDDLDAEFLAWTRQRFFGKYRGTVTDNNDKNRRGRLEVSVPDVFGTDKKWALPCVPYAGKDVGFYSLPDVGAGVWVEFEQGKPELPVWVGCFWADNELPDDAKPGVHLLKTQKGEIRIDDEKQEVLINLKNGSSVVLTGDAEVSAATFRVNDGALEVTK